MYLPSLSEGSAQRHTLCLALATETDTTTALEGLLAQALEGAYKPENGFFCFCFVLMPRDAWTMSTAGCRE